MGEKYQMNLESYFRGNAFYACQVNLKYSFIAVNFESLNKQLKYISLKFKTFIIKLCKIIVAQTNQNLHNNEITLREKLLNMLYLSKEYFNYYIKID